MLPSTNSCPGGHPPTVLHGLQATALPALSLKDPHAQGVDLKSAKEGGSVVVEFREMKLKLLGLFW